MGGRVGLASVVPRRVRLRLAHKNDENPDIERAMTAVLSRLFLLNATMPLRGRHAGAST
jgi:hypothetical protein